MNQRVLPHSKRKECYRLWFEYLKVARKSRLSSVKQRLKVSAAFYEPWEMDRYDTFDLWWKQKRHLFAENVAVRKLNPGEQPDIADALVLQIPLNKTQTELLNDVKKVLVGHYKDLGKLSRKDRLTLSSTYKLSGMKEVKVEPIRECLSIYRDVKLVYPDLRGQKLLRQIHTYYTSRRNKTWARVWEPLLFQEGRDEDVRRALRNMNRYLTNAETIVGNVAGGEFPGKY